jgi:RNA polymerase sigma-70 factor (ECF subfamily)
VSEPLSQIGPGGDDTGADQARGRLAAVFHDAHGAVVAALIRRFGDVELADDAVGDAYEEALRRWRDGGVPPNPAGWLTTTAKRKALDRLRREATRHVREKEAAGVMSHDDPPLGVVDDDRLRLLFMCCHPALALDVRIALTLRLVSGLSVREIAASFLVEERAMAQRITRAKRKIKDAGIPFSIPTRDDLPARLTGVLAVVYLMYNEGYLSHSAGRPVRDDLCLEAIRLSRLLTALVPGEPETRGLLALLLLTHARRPSRVDSSGLVLFGDQDRTRWDDTLLVEGLNLVADGLEEGGRPGHYQLLAIIAATHVASRSAEDVDWRTVLGLYDALMATRSTPVVALNRAIAVAHVDGFAAALSEVDGLGLDDYHPFHVVRAYFLEQLGRRPEAEEAIATALTLVTNPLERAHLEQRLRDLTSS